MARMYPRNLYDADVKSKAERRVFAALRDGLDDGWRVFHSASWVVRDEGSGAGDGEIDFVLVQPGGAIVCLEVKGGAIQSKFGEWSRKSNGAWERMRDPFQQALDHRYDLERLITDRTSIRGRELFIGHAVALPDIPVHALALAPDAPREIVLDRNDLAEPAEAIERVLAYHAGSRDKRRAPDEATVEEVCELLAPTITIEVPLAQRFAEEEVELVRLTHEQSALLARRSRERRMVVRGCAGSGKTMLAVEQARRWAQAGLDVAFVCFNRALRDHLRQRVRDDGISIHTFHGLCMHLAKRAEVELPDYRPDEPPQEYWLDELPDALMDAMTKLGPRYDALVVDEAQDLHTHWLTALMSTLRDERRNPVWLFTDDNQRVYESHLEIGDEYQPYDLTANCRNTQAIHREVIKKYRGEVVPSAVGPEGREPEIHLVADQRGTVAGVIERLCGQEDVAPQDVVVLSSHALAKSDLAHDFPGRWRLTDERGKPGDYVQLSSIRAFKGLESPVVILCELEDLDDMTADQQLYVGMSRAKNHCVVVAPG
jgi:hypothetical protein